MFKHNDFEILEMINEGDQDALKLMFDKYSPMIYKMIDNLNLMYDCEDMYQEGILMLYKSINKYNQNSRKTFTRYFEMNLKRKFISIVTKRVRRNEIFSENIQYIYENSAGYIQNDIFLESYREELKKILTKNEFLVYTLRELKNYSVSYIKEQCGLSEKVIYNSLYRAINKIQSHFAN